jgi:hypothetical protein
MKRFQPDPCNILSHSFVVSIAFVCPYGSFGVDNVIGVVFLVTGATVSA